MRALTLRSAPGTPSKVAEKVFTLEAKGVLATGASVDISHCDALTGWI